MPSGLSLVDKTLSPDLLKNSQNREAKTEYFNHLNHCFSLGVEYQSFSKHPKLHAYKISTSLDVYSRSYGHKYRDSVQKTRGVVMDNFDHLTLRISL